jgi:diacylglycerol O-acyltransferase
LFVAGAQLLHNIPVGPLSGVAFNLTLLSYNGNLDMGINTDSAAIDDSLLLKQCLDDAIVRFTKLAKK